MSNINMTTNASSRLALSNVSVMLRIDAFQRPDDQRLYQCECYGMWKGTGGRTLHGTLAAC